MRKKILRALQHRGRKIGLLSADRFVLFCHQRSGSNMMTSILNQHPQIIMRGQLFKDDPEYRADLARIGTVEFTGHLFDDGIDSRKRFDKLQEQPENREPRNAVEVVRSFYRGQELHTRSKTVGIKLHGGTLYTDEMEASFFHDIPYTFLILRRENLLAAAISWYQARTLDNWVARKQADVKRPSIEMDVAQLKWFAEGTRRDIELWKQLLHQNQQEYLELTYEQITSSDFSYTPVWKHLGVANLPTPPAKTMKLIKNYDHIRNIDEIRQAFSKLDFGMV